MTIRRVCPPAPGPLEDFAQHVDTLFGTVNQRQRFRAYLQGLLLARDRNNTLTGLAGTEPVVGAHQAAAQRLQFFLSEAAWEGEHLTTQRVELLLSDEATRPHEQGALLMRPGGQAIPGLDRHD